MSPEQSTGEPFPAGSVAVDTERREDGVVLHVRGALDLLTAATLTRAITEVLREDPAVLVIDLSGVGFLASRGLEALVLAQQAADGTSVRVVANSTATSRPLTVSGLTGYLQVYDSVASALAAAPGDGGA